MMHKIFIISALFINAFALCAQNTSIEEINNGLIIETLSDQSMYFNYKVKKKESLYRIAKYFQLTTNSIFDYNSFNEQSILHENTIIKIPFSTKLLVFQNDNQAQNLLPVYYKVLLKDNLYGLSKRKLLIDKNKLKKLNPDLNKLFQEGKLILIGYYSTAHFEEPEKQELEKQELELPQEVVEYLFNKESRGVAISESQVMGEGRLFALHNEAKMESIIEINNPILNKKVLAKVIGRIPPIYEKEVKVLVSAEVSRQLGVIGKRFFVHIRYR